MTKKKKYLYKIEALAPIIVSPRMAHAYYQALGDFDEKKLPATLKQKVKILYPFYQYGDYPTYEPSQTTYYLPGSTIKGALPGVKEKATLTFDDIVLPSETIRPLKIYKVQNQDTDSAKKITYGPFFDNVAVESWQTNSKASGCLFSATNPRYFFEKAHTETIEKLKQCQKQLQIAAMISGIEQLTSSFRKIDKLIKKQTKGEFLLIIGGYKGLLLSLCALDEEKSGLFIDEATQLPYGLVKITLLKEEAEQRD